MTITTILLDLDNTLIRNPDRAFAINFLARFNQHMQAALGITEAGTIFRESIRLASVGSTPASSNTQRLISLLAHTNRKTTDEVQAALDNFYANVYPELEKNITSIPEAAHLIAELKSAGYTLVIATNPLYSHEAVLQRMAWGNLPTEPDCYALITTADNMTHAKPHLAYYQQIITTLDIEPKETAMIGDSNKNDIVPAQTIGIETFAVQHAEDLRTIVKWLSEH